MLQGEKIDIYVDETAFGVVPRKYIGTVELIVDADETTIERNIHETWKSFNHWKQMGYPMDFTKYLCEKILIGVLKPVYNTNKSVTLMA